MATIERFEDLEVWKLAREFALDIYKITGNDNFAKDYRFCGQIRASAGSVMDNIAEGFERDGRKEFMQFLFIAKGSCGECRSQLYRALDVKYIDKETFDCYYEKSIIISKSLSKFIKYLKESDLKGNKYK
ncbi:MAG: four helix bundle protein [Tannerella sp.]|jgi:four helix bundle protein|nr:four helix bundle protein [Tannerella sp.]